VQETNHYIASTLVPRMHKTILPHPHIPSWLGTQLSTGITSVTWD